MFDPPFDISHLHEGEQNRIRQGSLADHERAKLAKNENPWPNPHPHPQQKDSNSTRTLRPDEYPKGNVAHTREWEPGDPMPPTKTTANGVEAKLKKLAETQERVKAIQERAKGMQQPRRNPD